VVQNLLFYWLYVNVKIRIYKIKSLLCMGENPAVTLREEHRMRVFENRVLRRIFGHKGMK
jgi:hypothetical protein